MTDLLGSMLPEEYSAPDVQSILGGDLLAAECDIPGSSPVAECPQGSNPTSLCVTEGL